jgi:hypothetical protein
VAQVSFELAIANVTIASAKNDAHKYKRAIAASLQGVDASQVESTIAAADGSRRLLASVTMRVKIKTFTIDSADSIKDAITSVAFLAVLGHELAAEGISATITIDTATVIASILVAPTPAPSAAYRHGFKLRFLNSPTAVRLVVGSPALLACLFFGLLVGVYGGTDDNQRGKKATEAESGRSQVALAVAGSLLVLTLVISVVASALVEAVENADV